MPSQLSNNTGHSKDNSRLILIGEDDRDDQELLSEIFSSIDESCSLLFAANESEIMLHLERCKHENLPCLIVLDYNMPPTNGAEILKELKSDSRYDGIPKIIWSTSRSATYKDICLTLGANDYLVKPSSVNELVEICRYMLSVCNV